MKAIKSIILLSFTLFNFGAYAQKVKIKKDKVFFDKVAVVNFQNSDSGFVFSSLKNENKITAKFKMLKISEDLTKKWVIVSDKEFKRTSEIEMEYLSVTMSNKKAVAELLAKKYNLITVNGVENIDAFFEVERPNLTKEYDDLVKGEAFAQKELKKLNITADYDLKRIFKGVIPYTTSSTDKRKREQGSYPNMLGTYTVKEISGSNGKVITIYDLNKKKVAVATPGSFKKVEVLLPQKGDKFEYITKQSLTQSASKYEVGQFVEEIVEQLFLKKVF